MLGSGTTYYTNWLNYEHGPKAARHEYVYGVKRNRDPAEGQLYEVSGFSFPYETDILLVRDPRKVIRGLKYHSPHYHNFCEQHLGYRPNTLALLVRSYEEFTAMALARDPEIIRIEDVPIVPDLNRNATSRGTRKPHTWNDIGPVAALAKGWGYV